MKTKRLLSIILVLCMVLSTLPLAGIPVFALTNGNYDYRILDGAKKTCEITDCTGAGGNITIPSKLDGYSVTSIGDGAFDGCTSLASVVIPDSVTDIDRYAFYRCTSLESVVIPDSVTSIGNDAFRDTAYYKDESNWKNNVLYIGNHLIEARDTISGNYNIKAGTKTIAGDAFEDCTSLASVVIPDSVTSIGAGAFRDCTSLKSIVIPDSVTSIGDDAFRGCTSLASVTIGNSVTSIDWYAFEDCTSLASVIIPDSVTSIGYETFCGCTSLASVIIPDSVKSISAYAFFGCKSLKNVYYNGTEAQWEKISVGASNQGLRNAAIHYNCDLHNSDYNILPFTENHLKIVDKETNQPIIGAEVIFNNHICKTDSSGSVTVISDANSLPTDEISISCEGYKAQSIGICTLNPYIQNEIFLCSTLPSIPDLADIYLEGEKIFGPTVNFLGQSFPLFNFEAKLKIPLTKISKLNVTTEMDMQEHRVKYILGYKPEYKLDTDKKRNEDYKAFKDFYQLCAGGSNQRAYDKYNSIRRKLKTYDGSLGFKCNMNFAGYLEFDYSSGEMKLVEGGMVVIAGATVSTDVTFAHICYATFKIGGEVNGSISLAITNTGYLDCSVQIGLAVKPTIGVGAKIISKDLASVEAGIDGKIDGSVKIPASSFKNCFSASLSANCYLKAKAFWIFEKKWTTNFPKLELYPHFGEFGTQSIENGLSIDKNGTIMTGITENDMELIDRGYLSLDSLSVVQGQENTLNIQSVFPYGVPELIRLNDGRIIAMYIFDDGTKSDINRTTLYYSVLENGSWSAPVPVNNSGRADFPVKICSDGVNVYALWQRAAEVLDNNDTADYIKTKTELVYSVFNGSSWSSPVIVDNCGKYQTIYNIAEHNGEISIGWTEKDSDNPNNSVVYTKTCKNGIWENEKTVSSETNIIELAVGYIGDILNVMYTVDGDGDYSTSGDTELYLNGKAVTANSFDEINLTYQNNRFWWIQDNNLYSYDGMAQLNTGICVQGDYRILSNGINEAVLFTKTDGFKNEFMLSYKNDGKYSVPAVVSKYGKHISYFDAVLNDDSSVSILSDIENLSEDKTAYPYTTTDMVWHTLTGKTDIKMEDIYYSGEIVPNSAVNFGGIVKNIGSNNINGYTVNLKSQVGKVLYTKDVSDIVLEPGQTDEFTLPYTIPENFSKQTLTVSVEAEDDYNLSNNTEEIEAGLADIAVINESLKDDGKVTASVINNGCSKAANVSVNIIDISNNSTVLKTINIASLNPGESKNISYILDKKFLEFKNAYVVNKFCISADCEDSESNLENNAKELVLAPQAVESITLNTSSALMAVGETVALKAEIAPFNAYNKIIHWVSDSVDVATVDDNGVIKGEGVGQAIITVITDEGKLVDQCHVTVSGIKAKADDINLNFQNKIISGFEPALKTLDNYIDITDAACILDYKLTCEYIGTGTVVNVVKNDKTVESYTAVLFGDVNGDGLCDGTDAVIVSAFAGGMLSEKDVTEAVYKAADCNFDGIINNEDVGLLQQTGAYLTAVQQRKVEKGFISAEITGPVKKYEAFKVKVVTEPDVKKIRTVSSDGETSTHSTAEATFDKNGNLVYICKVNAGGKVNQEVQILIKNAQNEWVLAKILRINIGN